jgi:hypothetical protein
LDQVVVELAELVVMQVDLQDQVVLVELVLLIL